MLELRGIYTTVRNENLHSVMGSIPPTECWIELWILDDDRTEEASQIVDSISSEPREAEYDWRCAGCGERIGGQFTDCWNCGSPSPHFRHEL